MLGSGTADGLVSKGADDEVQVPASFEFNAVNTPLPAPGKLLVDTKSSVKPGSEIVLIPMLGVPKFTASTIQLVMSPDPSVPKWNVLVEAVRPVRVSKPSEKVNAVGIVVVAPNCIDGASGADTVNETVTKSLAV